ncbi:hypothetical protein [Halomonas caseinilytica]|uniref:hypothetical protein n=1 Tax=Halomonas caseinilytica TaxID=438744 RepID=UPI00084840DF|nr:hypothetical protein [Halomonas caseinilytica]
MAQLTKHLAIQQGLQGMFIATFEYQGNHYLSRVWMIARTSHPSQPLEKPARSPGTEFAFKTISYWHTRKSNRNQAKGTVLWNQ